MSHTYYYFAASLPSLEFGGSLPFSTRKFLGECERLLHDDDYHDILGVLENVPAFEPRQPVTKKFLRMMRGFSNEMAVFRATRAKKDPLDFLRGDRLGDPRAGQVLSEAEKAGNPLESEKVIDQYRWQRLEELAAGHFFDFVAVFVFALQLKILERYQQISSEKGRQCFTEWQEKVFSEKLPDYVAAG